MIAMQIRFMGSRDLVERIKNLSNKKEKVSPNRRSDDVRYFINIDDRLVEQWLDLLENADTPITIDPRDFW